MFRPFAAFRRFRLPCRHPATGGIPWLRIQNRGLPQPVFPLEKIRRRGDVSAALPLPCLGVLPLAERVEDAGQAGKGVAGLKGHPFARGFAPASPVLFRERLEELVKRQRGLTGRDGFRLLIFRRAFNARAR